MAAQLSQQSSRDLFYDVTALFASNLSKSLLFHEHPGAYSGEVLLKLGADVFDGMLEGRQPYPYTISLTVPLSLRRDLIGDATNSLDAAVIRARELHKSEIGYLNGGRFDASIGYLFPHPDEVEAMKGRIAPVLVQSQLQGQGIKIFGGKVIDRRRSLHTFNVSVVDLVDELGSVVNRVLTTEGLKNHGICYGQRAGPLQRAVNDYVQKVVLPGLIGQGHVK